MSLYSVLATDTSCSTWHYYNNAKGQCECGSLLVCSDGKEVDIKIHDCATSSGQEDDYCIGACPFRHTVNSTYRMYSEMPSNASQLDEVMCGPYNRRGLLCGECKDGYGPAVYSFDMTCANCSSLWSRYAISLYLFLQFIPTTLIFLCFVVIRFDITSGPLLGYVLFCQTTIAATTYHYSFIYDYIQHHVSSFLRVMFDMSPTLSQFWSLQFLTKHTLTRFGYLQLMFIVTFLSPHILVAVWAGYTLTKHTLTRFGYQFRGPGCKVALSDMANGVRLCLCKRHRGYQELLPH